MEEKDDCIVVHSGNGNKSIGAYVDKISQELINNLTVTFKSYDKNMNKLITIEQIITRALDNNGEKKKNDSKINYQIGKENNIPYIKCIINIDKDDITYLEKIIGNKNNKRNTHPFTIKEKPHKMDIDDINNKNKKTKLEENFEKEEDEINNLCIQNIHDFFNEDE